MSVNVERDQMYYIAASQGRQKEGLVDWKIRDLERNAVS
jgi:hypothetical protein